jgi:hypothetical protein
MIKPLSCIYTGGTSSWKWKLTKNYVHTLFAEYEDIETPYYKIQGQKLTLKTGYSWDGATCAPDLASVMAASAIHDCLYQILEGDGVLTGDLKLWADMEFYNKFMEDGMPRWLGELYYLGVRVGQPIRSVIMKFFWR